MHDPISAVFAKNSTCSLAGSALPGAPVVPDHRMRRRGAARSRRLVARLRTPR